MTMRIAVLLTFAAISAQASTNWVEQLQGVWSAEIPDCVVGTPPFYQTKSLPTNVSLKADQNALVGDMQVGEQHYHVRFEPLPQAKKYRLEIERPGYQRRLYAEDVDDKLEFKSPQGDLIIMNITFSHWNISNSNELDFVFNFRDLQKMQTQVCGGKISR